MRLLLILLTISSWSKTLTTLVGLNLTATIFLIQIQIILNKQNTSNTKSLISQTPKASPKLKSKNLANPNQPLLDKFSSQSSNEFKLLYLNQTFIDIERYLLDLFKGKNKHLLDLDILAIDNSSFESQLHKLQIFTSQKFDDVAYGRELTEAPINSITNFSKNYSAICRQDSVSTLCPLGCFFSC